jgi:hypothetical protein
MWPPFRLLLLKRSVIARRRGAQQAELVRHRSHRNEHRRDSCAHMAKSATEKRGFWAESQTLEYLAVERQKRTYYYRRRAILAGTAAADTSAVARVVHNLEA